MFETRSRMTIAIVAAAQRAGWVKPKPLKLLKNSMFDLQICPADRPADTIPQPRNCARTGVISPEDIQTAYLERFILRAY
jgi:hypothetical protein